MIGPSLYPVMKIGAGQLFMMARPVPGEWIDEEFDGIAKRGIRRVVSLLELEEAEYIGLKDEHAVCAKHGMEFVSYPIRDRGLPSDVSNFAAFCLSIHDDIVKGINTIIHCRMGIGRSGIVAATVLLHEGFSPAAAFQKVSQSRGIEVPDTDEQREWLFKNAARLIAKKPHEGKR